MAYHPGMLKSMIDLQSRDVLLDDYGQQIGAWVSRRILPAAKLAVAAQEFLRADQFRADVRFKFVIRAQPDLLVLPEWRILEAGLTYRVSGILPTVDQAWLQIMCSAGAVPGVD